MTDKRKIIGFLCSVVFCIAIAAGMPQVAKAAGEVFTGASGKSGDLDWIITPDGELTITGSGDYECINIEYDYEIFVSGFFMNSISGPEWLKYYKNIHTVKVNATNITSTYSMFVYCINLTDIDMKNLDTSNVEDMTNMFSGCSNLNSLDVSKFNTSNVKSMYGMFADCSNLNSLDVSKFDTSNVVYMQNMFYNCINLESLDISNFNINKVSSKRNFLLDGLCSLEKLYFCASSPYEYAFPTSTYYHWINESNAICTKTAILDRKMTYTRVAKDYIPFVSGSEHIFNDYSYSNPVSGAAVIYGNGINKKVNGIKVNNKELVLYTDILASYKYTLNNSGIVKPAVGKVIVAVTTTNEKPVVEKNKVKDTSASKIARAKMKNGQITVTAVGKEGGLVYLWVIDTGDKGVSACCPVDVKLAPKKLEVQDTSGNKLTNTKLQNGMSLDVHVSGISGSVKTEDCTYTATVDSKSQQYASVVPKGTDGKNFTITANGLKGNKNTKATIIFTCDQNGKKLKFSFTITK